MAKKIPIKRSKNLVKLSHEHHHSLVFCTRLKKYLFPHFETEEKLFSPLMVDSEIKRQFLADHEQIRQLVQQLGTLKKDAHKLALKLSEQIINHIRFEEKIMFPYLEDVLRPNELAAIGTALSEIEITAQEFTPEFWKNEN